MEQLLLQGGRKLSGEVQVSCAKNALLPGLCASLLTSELLIFEDLPKLRDVKTMKRLLNHLGVQIEQRESQTCLNASQISSFDAPYELVKTMRASILVLGPLIARFGQAKVSLPGGCAIGARPIDLHLMGLEKLGAKIEMSSGYVHAKVLGRLKGAKIALPFPSVGATENLLMAASLARGESLIQNAAQEPEIDDLIKLLRTMGCQIQREGTAIEIQGQEELKGGVHRPIGDRIEALTFLCAALMTQGEVCLKGVYPEFFQSVLDVVQEAGAKIEQKEDALFIFPSVLRSFEIKTAPYPGIPTDGQAQMMALGLCCEGTSVITEQIFENRFMHVSELMRLGANISLSGRSAIVKGKSPLSGASVMCTDLRASAALVLAALVAKGETRVQRIYHLDRGYEEIEKKLQLLGAQVERVQE